MAMNTATNSRTLMWLPLREADHTPLRRLPMESCAPHPSREASVKTSTEGGGGRNGSDDSRTPGRSHLLREALR